MFRSAKPLLLAALAAAVPQLALAQAEEPGLIDRDLSGQLDFRDVAFAGCFEQPQCLALGVTITAERRDMDGETWVPAQLYWDPVDGIGVMAGGQNDEIDFDERVLVSFQSAGKGGTINIARVWLSDIFIGEDERYGNSDPAGADDVEVAVIQSMYGNTMLREDLVDGAEVLPPDPFNEAVVAGYTEGDDLYRRIVIRDDAINVVIPSTEEAAQPRLVSFPISQVDEDKLALFEGIETVEIDLVDILAGFNEAPFNDAGTANAEFIEAILAELAELQSIRDQAAETRLVSSVSNGELGVEMDAALDIETLVFMSVLGGSNDYSVAGIVQSFE